MRPLETLSLLLVFISLLFLFFDRERTLFLFLLFLTIIISILQYFMEGLRWQMYIFIYFLPAIYICHLKQKDHIHFIIKAFFSFWLLLAFVVPYVIPVFSLPPPQGKDFVGTETFHWVDS